MWRVLEHVKSFCQKKRKINRLETVLINSMYYITTGLFWTDFLHVLRKSPYFLMIFCTKLLEDTLIVSKQKKKLGQPVLGTFLSVLGELLEYLVQGNHMIFWYKILWINFPFWKRDQSWAYFHVAVLNKN